MTVTKVFPVTGPLLVETAGAMNELGLDAIANGVTRFDLAGVTEADSSALAVLLSWLRAAKAKQTDIQLDNVPSSLHSLADVYGISDLIPRISR